MDLMRLPKSTTHKIKSSLNITTIPHCVFELIFNALDARSTNIALRIHVSKRRIQIVDNGDGITPANLSLLGDLYVTNRCKKSSKDDQYHKKSRYYGYRGECLASIIQLSEKLKITSRTASAHDTYEVSFLRSHRRENEAIKVKFRPSVGTTVTIENFLYNIPVRQGTIRGDATFDHIRKYLEALSLIHTKVEFSLRNDVGMKILFKNQKCGSVAEAFVALKCDIALQDLCEVRLTKDGVKFSGLISKRFGVNKNAQYISVNKQPVHNTFIQKRMNTTLRNSARSMLDNDYPLYLINIKCSVSHYDIAYENSKFEVRFLRENVIEDFIRKFCAVFFDSTNEDAAKVNQPNNEKINDAVEFLEKQRETMKIKDKKITSSLAHTTQNLENEEIGRNIILNKFFNALGNPDISQNQLDISFAETSASNKKITKLNTSFLSTVVRTQNVHSNKFKIPIEPSVSVRKNLVRTSKNHNDNVQCASKQVQTTPLKHVEIQNLGDRKLNLLLKNVNPGHQPSKAYLEVNYSCNNLNIEIDLNRSAYFEGSTKSAQALNRSVRLVTPIRTKNLQTAISSKSVHVFNEAIRSCRRQSTIIQSQRKHKCSTIYMNLDGDQAVSRHVFENKTTHYQLLNNSIRYEQNDADKGENDNFHMDVSYNSFRNGLRNSEHNSDHSIKALTLHDHVSVLASNVIFEELDERDGVNARETNEVNNQTRNLKNKVNSCEEFDNFNSIFENIDQDKDKKCSHQDFHQMLSSNPSNSKDILVRNSSGNLIDDREIFQDVEITSNTDILLNELFVEDMNYIPISQSCAFTDWITQVDDEGIQYRLHSKTGCIKYKNNDVNDNQFHLITRNALVPKGQSPILRKKEFNMQLSPGKRKETLLNILSEFDKCVSVAKWEKILEEKGTTSLVDILYSKPKLPNNDKSSARDVFNRVPKKIRHIYALTEDIVFNKSVFGNIKVVGQWDCKFIVAYNVNDKLLMVFDQHAAHERIRLENICKENRECDKKSWKSAPWRENYDFKFSSGQNTLLLKYQTDIEAMGMHFIVNSDILTVNRIPYCIYHKCVKKSSIDRDKLSLMIYSFFNEVITTLETSSRMLETIPKIMQSIINMEACRGALKFGDKLTNADCEEMINDLAKCADPFHCAHGRPTMKPILQLSNQ